jgi:hypothetical protein
MSNHHNAADEQEIKDREQKNKNRRLQYLEDLRDILSRPSGVRFFNEFFNEGKMFCSTFTGNSQTFFNEGKRAVALKFFGDIAEAAPEKIPELLINKVETDE